MMKPLPVEWVICWFLGLMALLTAFFYPDIPAAAALLSFYLSGIVATIILFRMIRSKQRSSRLIILAFWSCLIIPLVFTSLGSLIQHVSPDDWHWHLRALDRQIFGTDPMAAVQTIAFPLLTDLLQIAYSSFYFLPIILGVFLFRQGKMREFEIVLTATVLGFFFSYLGYIVVPVRSPNEIFPGYWQEGLVVGDAIRETLRTLEANKRDCFPSGHTQMTLITLILAWKFHRRVFWFLSVPGTGLIFATVYLGYHYVIDLVAGAGFALATLWVFSPLKCPASSGPSAPGPDSTHQAPQSQTSP